MKDKSAEKSEFSTDAFGGGEKAEQEKLARLILLCSHCEMERITAPELASMLLSSPVWARLALTAPDERLRERAADTLAARIIAQMAGESGPDPRQIALPL